MNHLNGWHLEHSYTGLPEQFFTHINPQPVSAPKKEKLRIKQLLGKEEKAA